MKMINAFNTHLEPLIKFSFVCGLNQKFPVRRMNNQFKILLFAKREQGSSEPFALRQRDNFACFEAITL